MSTSATFSWPNKHRTLVSKNGLDYEWVDPADLRSESQAAILPEVTDYGVVGEDTPTGIVVCGDGLDAVDLLVAQGALTEKSIRCVYVDPPFNTGKTFGHYRDAMAESAWLSMMRDRLLALRPLLADDASVWIHLDETMSHKARLVADEVFGSNAYVATIVWQKRLTVESRTAISFAHDPVLVYAPAGPKAWKKARNRVTGGVAASNRDGDARGPWRDAPFTAPGYRSGQQYTIVNPAGIELQPPRGRSWFATQPVFERLIAEDRIWWTKNGAGQPRMKNFDIDALQVPNTIWGGRDVGTNDEAKKHLAALFADEDVLFDTPKPETLLQRILHIATNPGELVVDLFAGSGSTAATAHKMGRRWVAAERLVATTENVLIPRLKRVVDGTDTGGISGHVSWTGGGAFRVIQVQPRLGTVPALKLMQHALAATVADRTA
ncbi:site-specific DNA-methyltransferase [Nocardioides sp. NPDC092400]|uniref:site-specific DNA-methyltransferase n=1 Tax=Nocardioides sp. NPDC092400 TaxID=3155196 RepID=UPI003426F301